MVFDLGAAQDCLRATRETLNMFREDRVDRIGSRSRSRSRHATRGSDDRQGPHALQRRRPNHPTPNLLGWVCHLALRLAALVNYAICPFFPDVFHVSEIPWTAPRPLTTGPMVIHHRPPRLAPAEIQVWALQAEAESPHSRWVLSGLKRSRRPAIRCTVVHSLPPADSRLHENVAASQDFHLAHLPWTRSTPPAADHPYRYAGPTVADRHCWQVGPRLHANYPRSTLHLVWISACCIPLATFRCLFLDSLARHNGTRRWKLAMAAASAHLLLTMQQAFAYLCIAVRGSGRVSQGSCAFYTKSRPGPKSRGPSTMLCRALLLLLHSQSAAAVLRTEARVAALVTGAAEDAAPRRPPDARASKPGDLPQVSRLSQHGLVNRSVKRAYLRACRRALQQGHTRYRGRTLTAQEVPSQYACMEPHRIIPRPACQATAQALRGLHIFCWNSGGLGGGLYPELLTYLTASATDVAIILETKWQENMEFTTGPWTCIHGGCKSRKEAGILILVRQSMVPASQLRYEHLLQGRVAHVRIPLRGSEARHLHVIAVYQKVHNPKVASCMDQRQQVWQAIHRCLHGLPVRDSILLLGDFNTPVQTEFPYVGHHVSPLPSHPPEDMEELKLLMRTHALVAINTWKSNATPAATFKWGKAETQIDFLMVRQRDASVQAKKAAALRTFHVGASRHTGAIHFPVLACLNLRMPYWVNHRQQATRTTDREALLQAIDNPQIPVNAAKLAAIRNIVTDHIAQAYSLRGLDELHQVLHQACARIFPAVPVTPPPKPWQTATVQMGIKAMWAQWRAFKRIRKNGLQGWFAAWRAWKAFNAHHKRHQAACREARRNILLQAMEEAQDLCLQA